MTLADIARRYGTWSLAGFAICLVTWLILAALRCPFVLVARLLSAAQVGIDARIADRLAAHHDATATVTPASSSRRSHRV